MLNLEDLRNIAEIVAILRNIVSILVIGIAGLWGWYKINEYREFKQWIQFDIDANIYKLNTSIKEMKPFILEKDGTRRKTQPEKHTHAVEVVLKFTNKGKMRLRIYNIQPFFESYAKTKASPPVFCCHQQILNNPPPQLQRFAPSKTSPSRNIANNLI